MPANPPIQGLARRPGDLGYPGYERDYADDLVGPDLGQPYAGAIDFLVPTERAPLEAPAGWQHGLDGFDDATPALAAWAGAGRRTFDPAGFVDGLEAESLPQVDTHALSFSELGAPLDGYRIDEDGISFFGADDAPAHALDGLDQVVFHDVDLDFDEPLAMSANRVTFGRETGFDVFPPPPLNPAFPDQIDFEVTLDADDDPLPTGAAFVGARSHVYDGADDAPAGADEIALPGYWRGGGFAAVDQVVTDFEQQQGGGATPTALPLYLPEGAAFHDGFDGAVA